ncbi:MAG: mechanosensitive ion channel, partial [Candidatus Bathyarchaeia archaeon]
ICYKVISSLSEATYYSMRKISDHLTSIKILVKISGIAVLLSALTSMLGIGTSAALNLGSFSGLVVGFATQSILMHSIAGISIGILKPFKHGDLITIAGYTGIVKDIKLMHTVLESQNGNKELLIPNGKIIREILVKTLKNT